MPMIKSPPEGLSSEELEKWRWENKYRPKLLKTCLHFSKATPENQVWEIENELRIGELLFSFDGKNVYNLWVDYPHNFTKEQKRIFDKEQPYWAKFFRHRSKKPKKKDLECMEYERKSCPYLIRDTDPEWEELQEFIAEIKREENC